jgi:hypothetical protein
MPLSADIPDDLSELRRKLCNGFRLDHPEARRHFLLLGLCDAELMILAHAVRSGLNRGDGPSAVYAGLGSAASYNLVRYFMALIGARRRVSPKWPRDKTGRWTGDCDGDDDAAMADLEAAERAAALRRMRADGCDERMIARLGGMMGEMG